MCRWDKTFLALALFGGCVWVTANLLLMDSPNHFTAKLAILVMGLAISIVGILLQAISAMRHPGGKGRKP